MEFIPEDPIHPGAILRDDFLADYELSVQKAASDLGVNGGRLVDVLAGIAPIDAELALRLSRYFSTTAEFWLNLQRSYDLSMAIHEAKTSTAFAQSTLRDVSSRLAGSPLPSDVFL